MEEFTFTGKVLTWADLEKAAGNEPISEGGKASWDYFGFDRYNEWKAVLTGSEAVLVTDESMDLNMASVFPDMDSFIIWLEDMAEERQKEAEAERRFMGQKRQQTQQAQQQQRQQHDVQSQQ